MGIMTSPQRHVKSGVYYFRMAVPKALVSTIGKTVFKKSLGTTSAVEAKQRILPHIADAQEQIRLAELKLSQQPNIKLIVRDCVILAERWYKYVKDEVEATGEFNNVVSHDHDVDPHGNNRVLTFGLADTLSLDGRELATATVEQLTDLAQDLEPYITSQLEREGLVVSPACDAFRLLAKAFFPYAHRIQLLCTARHKGNWGYEPIEIVVGKDELSQRRNTPTHTPHTVKPASKVNAISVVLDQFIQSETLRHRGSLSRIKTLDETSHKVRRFIAIIGDVGVEDVSKADIVKYRDALYQLPKTQQKSIRSKSVVEQIEIAKEQDLPLLSANTVKNSLRQLSTVFSYAVESGLIDVNPTFGLGTKITTKKVEVGESKGYTDADIFKLFQSDVFHDTTASKPHGMACYWIPILCRYTGARLTEMAQLTKADVTKYSDNNYYINIRRGEGQSVKTDSSLRHIPVPQHLIELGFLDYVEGSTGELFPDIPKDRYGKKSTAFTKWWGRKLTKAGVSSSQPVHAFRHSFKTDMRSVGVADTVSDAISGHSAKTEGERYGTVTLETKQSAIDRLPRLTLTRL